MKINDSREQLAIPPATSYFSQAGSKHVEGPEDAQVSTCR